MRTRRKTALSREAPRAIAPPQISDRWRAVLVIIILGATAGVLGALYLLRPPRTSLDRGSAPPPLRREVSVVLPTAAEPRTVDELREQSERTAIELMRRYPDSPGALHVAATQYAELQQFAKAAEIWERCVKLAPDYAGPRVGLAMAAMERGDDGAAVEILEDALAAGCRTAEVFLQLAAAREKVGNLADAAAAASQGVDAFPEDAELWTSLGKIQLQREELADAEASLRQALKLAPDAGPAHFAMAAVSARLGRPEEAQEHRRRFAELRAANPMQTERFQVVYEATLRRITVTTLAGAAAEYERRGDSREAERSYLEAVALAPRHAGAYRWLASMYHKQGRIGDACLVQERLAQLEPGRVENHLNLASLLLQLGRDEEAEAVLLNVIRISPEAGSAYLALGQISLKRGEFRRASELAEQATRLAPTAEGFLLLASARRELGDGPGAESAMQSARQIGQ
jgi:tetratricopeptide (TPR) repeat protein